jgi:hypothetical protein
MAESCTGVLSNESEGSAETALAWAAAMQSQIKYEDIVKLFD